MAVHRRIRLGEVELAFEDLGAGPPVVLLHAFPLSARAWSENARAWSATGLRVIAFDYPGFGDSPPARSALTIDDLARVTGQFLDALEIERAALVGVSMGGYVALACAAHFPSRLSALVLADTRAAADGPAARQGRAEALATIARDGVETYLHQSLPRLLAPAAPPAVRAQLSNLAERREQTLTAGISALRDRLDRTSLLPQIACPTLVVVGSEDQVTPPSEMRDLAAAIPHAQFIELSGVGHLAHLEAPAAFNDAVGRFLQARIISHQPRS